MDQVNQTSLARIASLVRAAAWRAEAAHLLLFAVVPLAVARGEAAIKIVFVPFLLPSFGDRNIELTAAADHLVRPGCWVVLAPCDVADSGLLRLRAEPVRGQTASAQSAADEEFPPIEIADFLTGRHLWFAAWLARYLVHLVRRRRNAPPPQA